MIQRVYTSRADLHVLRAMFAIASAAFGAPAFAQQAAPLPANTAGEKPKEEAVELSPFVVNAQQDRGYRATTTLAGTRINTPLKDLASSITEITAEFLKDVSARDINDVLMYQANTESTHTFTNSPQSG